MRKEKLNPGLLVLWDKYFERDYDAFEDFPLNGDVDGSKVRYKRLERLYIRRLVERDGLVTHFDN